MDAPPPSARFQVRVTAAHQAAVGECGEGVHLLRAPGGDDVERAALQNRVSHARNTVNKKSTVALLVILFWLSCDSWPRPSGISQALLSPNGFPLPLPQPPRFSALCSFMRINARVVDGPPPELLVNFGSRCDVAQFTHANVLSGLRGRRLMFVGDSVARYEFLALASFLVHGTWDHPLVLGKHDDGASTILFADSWPSWPSYFEGSTAHLGPDSICDCYRNKNYLSERISLTPNDCARGGPDASDPECPMGGMGMLENRYVRIPAADFAMSFHFHVLPREPVFWHEPAWLGVDCLLWNSNVSGATTHDPEKEACPQSGCTPGQCRPRGPPSRAEPWRVRRNMPALATLLDTLKPDTLSYNMGTWIQNAAVSATVTWGLVNAAVGAANAGYLRRAIWRTSYAVREDIRPISFPEGHTAADNWLAFASDIAGTMPIAPSRAAAIANAFSVFDGHWLTDDLYWLGKNWTLSPLQVFRDEYHFTSIVYRWLALARLADLLNGSDARNSLRIPFPRKTDSRSMTSSGLWGIPDHLPLYS